MYRVRVGCSMRIFSDWLRFRTIFLRRALIGCKISNQQWICSPRSHSSAWRWAFVHDWFADDEIRLELRREKGKSSSVVRSNDSFSNLDPWWGKLEHDPLAWKDYLTRLHYKSNICSSSISRRTACLTLGVQPNEIRLTFSRLTLRSHLLTSHCVCFYADHFQVQELSSPPRASSVVKDCVKNCIRHTYNFLFANCDEVYKRESKQPVATATGSSMDENELTDDGAIRSPATNNTVGPNVKNLQFWHQLMYLLTCIISEDRDRYSLVLNQ